MRGLLNSVCQYLIAVGKCFQRKERREKNKIPGGLIFARPIFKNSHLILLRKFDTYLEILISVCWSRKSHTVVHVLIIDKFRFLWKTERPYSRASILKTISRVGDSSILKLGEFVHYKTKPFLELFDICEQTSNAPGRFQW